MKYLVIIVVLIFLFSYFTPILALNSKYRKTLSLLKKYNDNFDNDCIEQNSDIIMAQTPTGENLAKHIKFMVIPDIPIIEDVIPNSWNTISEIQSSTDTINNFKIIHSELITASYSYRHKLKKALRPTPAIQNTFLFPGKLLSWFGLHLGSITSRIWSIVIWIVTITLTTSIKEIVSTFLKNTFDH